MYLTGAGPTFCQRSLKVIRPHGQALTHEPFVDGAPPERWAEHLMSLSS